MKRRQFVKTAGIAGILAAGTAPAIIRAQEEVRWRLASSFPKSLDTIYGGAEDFAKTIAAATGGKFEISVHAAGELVPAFGVVDAIQQNTIQAAHTAPYYFFGKDETFALDCAIPFGMSSRQTSAWMYDGKGLSLLRDFYAQFNIVNYPLGNTGAQMGGWYRKEIKSIADIKGLKMRIGGFGGRILERIGGVPQNIPGGEVYQALEKGTIDAAEWIGPYDDEKLGFNEVAPYYYYPGWWEGGAQLSLFINAKALEKLSPEYQAILKAAASDAHVTMQAKYDARNPEALKKLIANGAKLSRLPIDVMDAAFAASRDVYKELNENNANWAKIYPDYSAFLSNTVKWFALAEASYGGYMTTKVDQL